MRRGGSRGTRVTRVLALGSILLGVIWFLVAGCKQGQGPTAIPDPGALPFDFLPPGNVPLGTAYRLGLFYRFDSSRYEVFFPVKGT